jgi:hemophore
MALAGAAITAAWTTASDNSASAAPDPCAASQIAKTIGSVATNTGTYLEQHPQTNQALTTAAAAPPGPQSLVAVKAYFDANAQAGKDLQAIQQPLTALSAQCRLPISLPQLLGLIQSAQAPNNQSSSTQVPGTQTTGAPTTPSAVPAAVGPLPGPAPKAG